MTQPLPTWHPNTCYHNIPPWPLNFILIIQNAYSVSPKSPQPLTVPTLKVSSESQGNLLTVNSYNINNNQQTSCMLPIYNPKGKDGRISRKDRTTWNQSPTKQTSSTVPPFGALSGLVQQPWITPPLQFCHLDNLWPLSWVYGIPQGWSYGPSISRIVKSLLQFQLHFCLRQ